PGFAPTGFRKSSQHVHINGVAERTIALGRLEGFAPARKWNWDRQSGPASPPPTPSSRVVWNGPSGCRAITVGRDTEGVKQNLRLPDFESGVLKTEVAGGVLTVGKQEDCFLVVLATRDFEQTFINGVIQRGSNT